MVQRKKTASVLLAILAAIVISACFNTRADAEQAVHGRAYLFYGLIPQIDWGMDELAQRINRSGIAAGNYSHASWRGVADQAISDYRRDPKPVAVVGHSIGGNSAVEFAQALGAARVPVSLLITYDPNRGGDTIPANVHRYINLYQSSNILGGGDLPPGPGFHGHYASYNLKDRSEIIHVNLDKFSRIQELLAAKVRSMGAGGEGEAVPLRIVFAATGPIELSGLRYSGLRAWRRDAASTRGELPCAGVGGRSDQSEVRGRGLVGRRAHRRTTLSRPEDRAIGFSGGSQAGLER